MTNDEFIESMKRAIAAIDEIPQSKYLIVSKRGLDIALGRFPCRRYKAKKLWQRGSR